MEPSPPPLPARQIGVLGLGQLQLLLQPGLLHEAWGRGRCTARGRGGLGSGITTLGCMLPPSPRDHIPLTPLRSALLPPPPRKC